jgi:hypothetical protein
MPAAIRIRQDGDDLLITFERTRKTKIAKLDADRQIVFGWANVCVRCSGETVVDSHEDTIAAEDLESAAYDFNLSFRETGEDHEGDAKGRLIESFFVTPEKLEKMGLKKNALPRGWWVGFKIDDAKAWQRVKKGDLRMFSIQGVARREVVS